MPLDAIVIGGSFAGLSAATYLALARRNVRVIDAGLPRNRFALKSHGFLGHDGSDPRAMLAASRKQVEAYPTVRMTHGEAVDAGPAGNGFSIRLATGETVEARKLVLAFGVADVLPVLPGLEQRWGRSVHNCPYCDGFEFSDHRLGVLYMSPKSVRQAIIVAEWGPTTLYLGGQTLSDAQAEAELARRRIRIEPAPIASLEGEGDSLSLVRLNDGRSSKIEVLYVAPHTRPNSRIAEQLGCALDEGPSGPMLRTDADKMTTVPGVYAAGDIARPSHSVSYAAADGVTAGTAAHRSLVFGTEG